MIRFAILSSATVAMAGTIHGESTRVSSARVAQDDVSGANGQFKEARNLLLGIGVEKDPEKAFDMMNAAAALGHADATGALGYCYLTGSGVGKDTEKAVVWFRKGAELGSAKAQLNLARWLLGTQELSPRPKAEKPEEEQEFIEEGLSWLRKSADQGLTEAKANLGSYYFSGNFGLPEDKIVALRWLTSAAEAGDAGSQNRVGAIHDLGYMDDSGKLHKDAGAAEKWYRLAARQGHRKAQANLGKLLDPFGKDKDRRIEAIAWTIVARDNQEITAIKRFNEFSPAMDATDLQEAAKQARTLKFEIVKEKAAGRSLGSD